MRRLLALRLGGGADAVWRPVARGSMSADRTVRVGVEGVAAMRGLLAPSRPAGERLASDLFSGVPGDLAVRGEPAEVAG